MIGSEKPNLQEFLYTNLKRGNWNGVVARYAEDPEAHRLKLTQSGDTALHLAVFDNQQDVVEKLVNLITCRSVFEIKNDKGHTPLHIAAWVGNAAMCHSIASKNTYLVDQRNDAGETPLFLAALHANKKAFNCLYYFCYSDLNRITSNCRRTSDGVTVLHCALKNDQFDLAFQIIEANEEAATWVDKNGLTPLHVLATKPTAFRSGAYINGWKNIVYYCMFVDKLKPASARALLNLACKTVPQQKEAPSCPENYATCLYFIKKLWQGFLIISSLKQIWKNNDGAKNDTDLEKGRVDEESKNCDTNNEAHERPNTRLLEADHDQSSASKPKIGHFPENYRTCVHFFQIVFTGIFIILGLGSIEIKKIRRKKQKHTWSVQVMEKLVELTPPGKYFDDGNTPVVLTDKTETLPYTLEKGDEIGFNTKETQEDPTEKEKKQSRGKRHSQESAMLLAAKNGVVEMVRRLFIHFPLAIRDTNAENKNVVLLAAEYRQPDVYKFLHDNRNHIENVFRAVDHKGNSALHLAAHTPTHKPWRINGAAFQMQWEYKWYKFVKESMHPQVFASYNNEGRLAKDIFHESHKEMVKNGSQWLSSTSQSCSVVATLITTVAFASATAIPGGNGDQGTPPLEKELGFLIFALSSLLALCLSATSVIMFLAILTSRFDDKDFRSNLPIKLLIGLSSLFFSIITMLASFCAGHFFLLRHRLHSMALVIYIALSLPVAIVFAILQLPLYYDLLVALVNTVPRRSAQVIVGNKGEGEGEALNTCTKLCACIMCCLKDTTLHQSCKGKTE